MSVITIIILKDNNNTIECCPVDTLSVLVEELETVMDIATPRKLHKSPKMGPQPDVPRASMGQCRNNRSRICGRANMMAALLRTQNSGVLPSL